MNKISPAASAASPTRSIAALMAGSAIALFPAYEAAAQQAAPVCKGVDCSALPVDAGAATPAIVQTPSPARSPVDAVDATEDLVLPAVSVEAAAPEARPSAPPAPRRAARVAAPATVDPVAAPDPEVPAAARNPESRFAARPARVQDRTTIGRLTVDTPQNGTTVNRDTLEAVRSINAETDLLLRIPGISMIRNIRIPSGGKGYTNNLIDGFSVRSQTLGKFGFLDEVNLWDVEEIDIIRGPASVLFPSKGVGGTINVISRKPPDEQETQASLEFGSASFKRGTLNMAGPLGSGGTLGYLLSLNKLETDGWRERSAADKLGLSGKLVWAPTDRTEITFRAEYQDYYQEHSGRLTREQFDADWSQAQYVNLYEDKQAATLSVVLKHQFDDARRIELGYSFSNTTGTDACPSGCSSRIASLRQVEVDHDVHNLRALYVQDFASMDSRLSMGIDASYARKRDDTWSRATNSFTPIARVGDDTIDETSVAPFAQFEFSPANDLRFTLGARYETYDLEATDHLSGTTGKESYSTLVTKAGMNWEYAPDKIFWASVAEGFYVPSTNDTITNANARPLPPEKSLTYSVGLRGEFSRGTFGYDVGVYHSTIRNQAITVACGDDAVLCPADPGGDYPVAAGKVRYQGVESSFFWRASDQFRFDLSHTYARNRYVSFVTDSGDFSGNKASASPLHHLNLRATYSPNARWDAEFEADWISAYKTNEINTDTYQRPIIFNLRANHDISDKVSLFGAVENLTDRKYAKRVSSTNEAVPVRGYSEGYSERTFRLGLVANF